MNDHTMIAPVGATPVNRAVNVAVFMSRPIKLDYFEETPMDMLRWPGMNIGIDNVAEEWIDEIIASEDPDAVFSNLTDHLLGLLQNLGLLRKHYAKFTEEAA